MERGLKDVPLLKISAVCIMTLDQNSSLKMGFWQLCGFSEIAISQEMDLLGSWYIETRRTLTRLQPCEKISLRSERMVLGDLSKSQVEYVRRETAGIRRKSPERGSNILVRNFRNFSREFQVIFLYFPVGTDWNITEKFPKLSDQNTASISGAFRCFPAGYGVFSRVSLPVPAVSVLRNHWPGKWRKC